MKVFPKIIQHLSGKREISKCKAKQGIQSNVQTRPAKPNRCLSQHSPINWPLIKIEIQLNLTAKQETMPTKLDANKHMNVGTKLTCN